MRKLCFASFAKAIEHGMDKPNNIKETQILLDFITLDPNVKNKEGKQYNITSKVIRPWWNGAADIPANIKRAVDYSSVLLNAGNHFTDNVIPELLSTQKERSTYEEVFDLVNCTEIPEDIKTEIIQYYNDEDWGNFLGHSFLAAISQSNVPPDNDTVIARVKKFHELLAGFEKPIILEVPENLEEHEMTYVQELLKAYADSENVNIIRKDELEQYPQYKKDFERRRKDYYAAESIRQSARDILSLDEKEDKGFDALKEETFEGIVDVCENDFVNGFTRLKAVMNHVTTIRLSRSVLSLMGWVGSSEAKGICHMLVNDEKIRWVD